MRATIKPAVYALITLSLAALINLPAFGHHLASNNRLTFAPVLNSPSPEASGMGTVNFIKGASGETDDTTMFNSAFAFMGLDPNTAYTVTVRGAFGADPNLYGAICSFVTNANGNGACETQIVGLRRLQVAQLRLGDENGTPVLQATREGFGPDPGLIESRGGCREEAGETCEAPGRQ